MTPEERRDREIVNERPGPDERLCGSPALRIGMACRSRRTRLLLLLAKGSGQAMPLASQEGAKRFRAEAEECRQQAESVISQDAKEAWLRLAGDWIKLAEGAELRLREISRSILK